MITSHVVTDTHKLTQPFILKDETHHDITHINIASDSLDWDLTDVCGTQVMVLYQTLFLAHFLLLYSLVTSVPSVIWTRMQNPQSRFGGRLNISRI